MSKKKTNPHNIPCSKADVDRAMEAGSATAQKISIYVLKNYFGFDNDGIRKFCDSFSDTVDSIVKGYITVQDIESVLNEEYQTQVNVKER